MSERAGKLVKNLSGEMTYYSFRPSALPPVPDIEIDSEMQQLLIEAYRKISFLEGLSSGIPNRDLFISMYVRKEALVSSQIEGTQCTIDDIFDPSIDENANANVSDVVNYVRAINFAVERMKGFPLCNRLIREIHAVLMKSIRGCDKTPGEFRKSQNWIGGAGSTLKNARYIPPNYKDMLKAMNDLERFINREDGMDPIIKSALIHYQFESIHPFLDGNGRIGRLLITLFLMKEGILSSPVLYLSCYLKANRTEYYDRLSDIRNNGTFEQWIKFFLRGIAETAQDATTAIKKLNALHAKNDNMLPNQKLKNLLTHLESNPIITIPIAAECLQCSRNTMASYVKLMCSKGILKPSSKTRKTVIYSYDSYLNILREGTTLFPNL